MADIASTTRNLFSQITSANDTTSIQKAVVALTGAKSQLPSPVYNALADYVKKKISAAQAINAAAGGGKNWPAPSSLFTGMSGRLGPISKSGAAKLINFDIVGAEKIATLGVPNPPSGIKITDVSESGGKVYVDYRVTGGGQQAPNLQTILNLIPSTPSVPEVTTPSGPTSAQIANFNSLTKAVTSAKDLASLTTIATNASYLYKKNGITQDQYQYLVNLVGVRRQQVQQIESAAVKAQEEATRLFNSFKSQIESATSAASLQNIVSSITANKSKLSSTQYGELASLAQQKMNSLQATTGAADKLSSLVQEMQAATSVASLKAIYERAMNVANSQGFSASQKSTLNTYYTNKLGQLQQTTASRYSEFAAEIARMTTSDNTAWSNLFTRMTTAANSGQLTSTEMQTLNTLAQQKRSALIATDIAAQQAEQLPEVTVPEVTVPEVTVPTTVPSDLPTMTQILSAPDTTVLSNYERLLQNYLNTEQITREQYIPLNNAVSIRRDQLLAIQQAAAITEADEDEDEEPMAPTIINITQPAPVATTPTAPTIITTPSAPSPIIVTQPSAPAAPAQPAAPAPAPVDWSFMTPGEGPPLPKSLGIRWPWFKPEAAG